MSSQASTSPGPGSPLQQPVPHTRDNLGLVAGPPNVTWRPNVVCQPLTMAKTHEPVYFTNAQLNNNVPWAPTVSHLTTGSQKSNIHDKSFVLKELELSKIRVAELESRINEILKGKNTGNLPTTVARTQPQSYATFTEAGCSHTCSIPITSPSNSHNLSQLTCQTANLEIKPTFTNEADKSAKLTMCPAGHAVWSTCPGLNLCQQGHNKPADVNVPWQEPNMFTESRESTQGLQKVQLPRPRPLDKQTTVNYPITNEIKDHKVTYNFQQPISPSVEHTFIHSFRGRS